MSRTSIARGGPVLTRRRALTIIAGAAATSLLPGRARAAPPLFEWQGEALGAQARLVLAHDEPEAARAIIRQCVAEVARLERIFSLHLPDSELSRLNRNGRLAAASHDLRLVVSKAVRFGERSGGAFDVTVQPLWELYAAHFARRPDADEGPPEGAIARALTKVDFRAIAFADGGIGFRQSGMAATLNGIAQGYITDRVAGLLREAGLARVLVQLGETFAGAPPEAGAPWRIGVRDPLDRRGLLTTLPLENQAIATSSGFATRFDARGRYHHLFDPRTGRSASRYRSVSVVALTALAADALSTALSLLPLDEGAALLRAGGGERALYQLPDGRLHEVTA